MSSIDGASQFSSTLLTSMLANFSAKAEVLPQKSAHIIEAQVVARAAPDSIKGYELGVVVDGEFVAVNFPEEINVGDKVKLQVSYPQGKISLEFLEKSQQVNTRESESNIDIKIQNLLKALNVSEEAIESLKKLVIGAQVTPDKDPLLATPLMPPELKAFLLEKGVISNKELGDPKALEQILKSNKQLELLNDIKKVSETISNLGKANEKSRVEYEKIQHLVQDLKRALLEVSLEIQEQYADSKGAFPDVKRISKDDAVKEKSYAIPLKANFASNDSAIHESTDLNKRKGFAEVVESLLSQLTSKNPLGKAINRLLDALGTIAFKAGEVLVDGENKLKQVVRQQIENVKLIEKDIKNILLAAPEDSNLDSLITLLNSVDLKASPDDSKQDLAFKNFVRNLLQTIQKSVLDNTNQLTLRDILKNALKVIEEEFKLPPLAQRVLTDFKGIPLVQLDLKPQYLNLLKSFEVQIKLILDSPNDFLFGQSKAIKVDNSPAIVITSKNLLKLIESIHVARTELGIPQTESERIFSKFLEEVDKNLQHILKSGSSDVKADNEIRKYLKEVLRQITTEFSPNLLDLPTATDVTKKEEVLKGKPLELNIRNHEILNEIKTGIEELLKVATPLVEDRIDNLENPVDQILKSQQFKNLMNIIKKIESIIPDPYNLLEQELVQFAEELSQQLDRDSSRSPAAMQEGLRKALDHIQTRLSRRFANTDEQPLLLLQNETLKSLETVVQSQEALARLNPLMQAAGEPVMMLFPSIMQGMLTKLEVQFGTAKEQMVDSEQSKSREGGNRQGFERVSLNLELPAMGAVRVDLAFRNGEALLSLNFDKEEVCHFVREKVWRLEQAMRFSGYEKTSSVVKHSVREAVRSEGSAIIERTPGITIA